MSATANATLPVVIVIAAVSPNHVRPVVAASRVRTHHRLLRAKTNANARKFWKALNALATTNATEGRCVAKRPSTALANANPTTIAAELPAKTRAQICASSREITMAAAGVLAT